MKTQEHQEIKLYFDENKVCLGGVADSWWLKDYSGDYWASEYFWLPTGYDPVGKSADELNEFSEPPRPQIKSLFLRSRMSR
jgi:hypothetical protein